MSIGDCLSCKFSEFQADQTGRINFNAKICKRFPPSPIAIPTPHGIQIVAAFPPANKGVRCHEFATASSDVIIEGKC